MKKHLSITLLVLLSLFSLNCVAKEVECTAKIKGKVSALTYDTTEAELKANYSLREKFLGKSKVNTCPALVTLRHLTPNLTEQERSAFCLQFDENEDSYTGVAVGERDAYLNCRTRTVECTAKINGKLNALTYDANEDELKANYSLREKFLGGSKVNTCPALVTLRHLTPKLTEQERSAFCLRFDKSEDSYLGIAMGERDAYLNCRTRTVECTTKIDGELNTLKYDTTEDELKANYSLREKFLGGSKVNTCPAFITLRHLTPHLTDQERTVFCLKFDESKDSYTGFTLGERDAYLNCRAKSRSYCEFVNDSKDTAMAIAGLGAGAAGGTALATSAAGVTAVAHSSGAVILTGSSGYIAGTLGTLGSGAVALLTAPATLTAAAVSVVAVGGSVYLCKDDSKKAE